MLGREGYQARYDDTDRDLLASQGTKRLPEFEGCGPDVGIRKQFLRRKVLKWFDKHGEWIHNYGLSLVAFVPDTTDLHKKLVEAQADITSTLGDAWIPIQEGRLHMSIGPVNVNRDLARPRRCIEQAIIGIQTAWIERTIPRYRKSFTISFERGFQSPFDGRYSVAGIPDTDEDENALTKPRRMLGYENPIIHVGLGSVVSKIDAARFRDVYSKLAPLRELGTLKVTEVCLVCHPTDHLVKSKEDPGDVENMIRARFPLL